MLYVGISVLVALVLHELGHAFVSYKLGDPTPKEQGRLSLNPLVHLDLIGTFCLFFFGFGWAKPVGIDYRYYKQKKLGVALVSLAGPCVNFLLGFIGVILYNLIAINSIHEFLNIFIQINVGLGVFNLIPIPPLDGSKVVGTLIPDEYYDTYMGFEQFGMIFLLILLSLGFFNQYMVQATSFIINLFFSLF